MFIFFERVSETMGIDVFESVFVSSSIFLK